MTMSSMRFRNSGAKVSSSARRYSDCGAFCWVSDFEQVLYPTCVERIAAARDPTLEVRMITVFRKSTGDEEDEEDRAAERSGGQRRGVVASVTADHDVVGDLYEDLPQLGHHDGQGQFQIGFVLSFVG